MDYKDAFKIGSNIEGYVKCTFAIIHSPEIDALFSVSQARTSRGESGKDEVNEALSGIGKTVTDNGYYEDDPRNNVDDEIFFSVEFPIVRALEQTDEKFVPVKLTQEAIDWITNAMERHSGIRRTYQYKYIVWRVWDKDGQNASTGIKKGTRINVQETYTQPDLNNWKNTDYYHYEVQRVQVLSDRYNQLVEGIRNNATFYVLNTAIDWIPTNINGATITDENGNEILLEDALAAAQKRLGQAKALLATAGAFAIF